MSIKSVKDLANLFKWNKKIEIKNRDGSVAETLYLRLVGDLDYQQAQQHSLIASRTLRKRLRDETTSDNQALFLDLNDRTSDELIFGILMSEVNNFRDDAITELGTDFFKIDIKLPDDPTLEDREQQQADEEAANKKNTEALKAAMDKKSNKRQADLKKLADKEDGLTELRKIYVDSSINIKCLEEFGSAFREYCVFMGTYSDPKFTQRAFNSFDEFRNIASNLKRQLTDAYLELEISGEQLKN